MRLINNLPTYSYTIVSQRRELQYETFQKLKNDWLAETMFVSSPKDIYSNKHYKNIIRYGLRSLPYILADLEENNNNWFFALSKITGTEAVKEENRGNVAAMVEDWMTWKSNKPNLNVLYASTFSTTIS